MNNGPSFFAITLRQSRIDRSRTLSLLQSRSLSSPSDGRFGQEKAGPEGPAWKTRVGSEILVSILAGGLLHGDVAGGAELDGQVHHTIAIAAHIPGARGGAEDGKVGQAVRSVGDT